MNQEGVAISNAFQRVQGRLKRDHNAFDNRLRLGLNVTTSHTKNDYITFESTRVRRRVFQNVAIFNPTQPVRVTDPRVVADVLRAAGQTSCATRCAGEPDHRHRPDDPYSGQRDGRAGSRAGAHGASECRGGPLGWFRNIYLPRQPVEPRWRAGAPSSLDNTTVTLQTLLTLRRQLGDIHSLDVVGGYEFSKFNTGNLTTQGQDT